MAKGTGGPAGDECQNLIAATMHTAHCPTDGSGIVAATLRRHPRPGSDTLGACTLAPTIDTKATRMGGVVGQATVVVKTDNTTSNGCGVLEDGTTHTLGGSQDAVMQEEGIRRFTPRECERLQGFPDDWTLFGIDEAGERVEQSDTVRYEQLGNAVSTTVAEFISRNIKRELRRSIKTR